MAARMSICGEGRGEKRRLEDEFHNEAEMRRAMKASDETKDIEDKKRSLLEAKEELAVAEATSNSLDVNKNVVPGDYEQDGKCTICTQYEKVSAARLEPRASNLLAYCCLSCSAGVHVGGA